MIKTKCPHCQVIFKVADQYKGQRARCSKCGQSFVIATIKESKPADVCSHCQRTISADEEAHVFNDKIVCRDCDVKLRNKPVKTKPAKPVSAEGPASGGGRDTTNKQQRSYVPMTDWASLLPWIAAKRLKVTGPVDPDASNVWMTVVGWIARGEGVGWRYFWFLLLYDFLIQCCITTAVMFTCGLGVLFLAPHLAVGFLGLHLRLLYGKATGLRNQFDGFKHYVELLVLVLITFGLMVVFWIVSHIILSMILMSMIDKVWRLGPVGMFAIILLGVLPFVLVAGINLVFFMLPSLMVMDRSAGPIVALRLTLVEVLRHIKVLVLYVAAISLLLGIYVAIGVVLIMIGNLVSIMLGLAVFVMGYGHYLIGGPGWIAVVYESFFPPTKVIRLTNGQELPSLISQETQTGHS